MSDTPEVDFYYAPTPNGWKIAIFLEEAELPYRTHLMRLSEGDQFDPGFLKISPNAKMPAIVDRGTGTSVFESGAILIYLAEKTGRFLPGPEHRLEMLQWLFWQAANQGPLAGQLSHFVNYAPEGQDYGRDRYRGEYERNLAVLETRLDGRDWMVGDAYS
ncbi:MAG TPA: glutathione S-transferase N-terminal domain-containing protein, partial [Thermohalobaculum sp.]|nr:glutathione S-transferase N-terminal domain-containing protein [Thermohalobaculum sp.]